MAVLFLAALLLYVGRIFIKFLPGERMEFIRLQKISIEGSFLLTFYFLSY